eukprot:c20728_g1_i9.p1 GENE.c20728_g1_i9~~c20728_g1_i9.p1  ORF type:complete len:490 (+),score=121.81 c20728_g1_i9:23-1471(+)
MAEGEPTKIVLGVCAMKNKVQGEPMQAILAGLRSTGHIDIVEFSEEMILEEPVESWPVVRALISFYSTGFPIDKAEAYVKLVNPFCINNVQFQRVLLDRRQIYATLIQNELPVVNFAVCERDENGMLLQHFEEHEDSVVVGDKVIKKPFVEKPIDAEDHNIYIYYPTGAGGGSKRLFRKVKDKSSSFHPDISTVRKTGSYIYEDFLSTEGYDVKVYTIGPHYAHAEARRSPTLDGKVERRDDGKEQRYPIVLSASEKGMARKIVRAFHQAVCGFDLLRSRKGTFVCDVNGWSFVKGSDKFYEDAVSVLSKLFLHRFRIFPQLPASMRQSSRILIESSEEIEQETELRCVVAVIRHADRTPKQKIKFSCHDPRILAFHAEHGTTGHEMKLKSAEQLSSWLQLVQDLVADPQGMGEEEYEGLKHTQEVLTQNGGFQGINRKVQLKPAALNDDQSAKEILVVVKWGGVLTQLGREQVRFSFVGSV